MICFQYHSYTGKSM